MWTMWWHKEFGSNWLKILMEELFQYASNIADVKLWINAKMKKREQNSHNIFQITDGKTEVLLNREGVRGCYKRESAKQTYWYKFGCRTSSKEWRKSLTPRGKLSEIIMMRYGRFVHDSLLRQFYCQVEDQWLNLVNVEKITTPLLYDIWRDTSQKCTNQLPTRKTL